MTGDNESDTPTPPPSSGTNAPPSAAASAAQSLLGHIEAAGKDELHALKPLVASIVRKFAASWESQHGGITGKIEGHILNAVIDSAFGPAPE